MALASGRRLGPYEILDLIGAGGMGEVYKARDTRLVRTVAVKVLAADLAADAERRHRFELEARAASALNHPHICTLFDIGSQDGTDFLVMEYLEGETLARRLLRGPLPLHEVLTRGVEIADALSTAHQQGIVHRDLKPANVMLTRHGVKLLDFGLARLTQASALSGQSDTLTASGVVVGTLPYMAPEQLEGKGTDARTDVFAFGLVLYEMLTGTRPFKGDSQASIIAAILDRDPPPLSAIVSVTPPALEHVIQKCLAKDPGARWQSAADVADELRWIAAGSGAVAQHPSSSSQGVSTRRSRATRSRLAWAAIAVAVLSACVVAGVLAWRYVTRGAAGSGVDSVAVLPLRNATGDPAIEYLSDGITDSLISTLSNRDRLRVMASSTMFTYKGRQVDPRQVGRELSVRAVFTGRVSQQGDVLTIDAEVVNADDGSRRWGRQYSGRLAEVVVMQTDLARAVSESLRPTLTPDEQRRMDKRPTQNADAYRLYLQGRHHLTKWSENDIRQGIECFKKAIDVDPGYALAYAGLAYAYYSLGWLGRAYALAGRTSDARRMLREMQARSARENVAALTVAMVYQGLGDRERTLEWLEKGLERRDEEMTYLNVDPRFDGLKSDPRFTALLRTMHLVP